MVVYAYMRIVLKNFYNNWLNNHGRLIIGIDFYKEKLGRAHQMRFGAYSLYSSKNQNKEKEVTLLNK